MPDIPKMITIQEARRSQSGKSLGIQDRTDNMWYQTKDWSLEMMVGATIYAQTSTSEFNGKQMHWINSYSMPEGQGQGMAGAAPQVPPVPPPAPLAPLPPIQTPVQHPQQPITPQPQPVDRDASIVAQTLCKCVTFSSIGDAVSAYMHAYQEILGFRDEPAREAEANEVAQNQGQPFTDDIPF